MTSLRQRMIEDMQVRNFSPATQASYTREVSGFARYFNKSPELLGPEQIRAYQVHLTKERKLGVVSISVATSALRFLYRVTLKIELLKQLKGVGTQIALTYVLTLDDPHRFPKSREVGCFLGLRPRRRDSGESQPQMRISKEGDRHLRTMLVRALHPGTLWSRQ